MCIRDRINRVLPIYTRRYVVAEDRAKEKRRGKRPNEFSAAEYGVRELKYKCTCENSLTHFIAKNKGTRKRRGAKGEESLDGKRNGGLNNHISNTSEANEERAGLKTPMYYLARAMKKRTKSDPEDALKRLLLFEPEKEKKGEINLELYKQRNKVLLKAKLDLTRMLEGNYFSYQNISKFNWEVMTNTWYQSNRHISHYARKPVFVSEKPERNGQPLPRPEHNSALYPSAYQQQAVPRKFNPQLSTELRIRARAVPESHSLRFQRSPKERPNGYACIDKQLAVAGSLDAKEEREKEEGCIIIARLPSCL
eukprot:TRINITY_DN7660_c0_g1_i8.p1 TRINITY_DN7660_c0_g1~~TRINITY_DN7660_c0_g1_i8.p1  ORF type:complete len:309 (-),score=48.19 TRINITY_DN7660_c0_g1_i8:147-1073(-)